MPSSRFTAPLLIISLGIGCSGNTGPTPVSTAFDVKVIFFGGTPNPALQAAFTSASARLATLITGGPASEFPFPISSAQLPEIDGLLKDCGAAVNATAGTINGVVIYAKDTSSLGGGIIANSQPCIERFTSHLTLYGVMKFSDVFLADMIATGQINAVVLHEMTHVIGFNKVQWALIPDTSTDRRLIANQGATPPNPSFRGAHAISACLALPLAVAASCSPSIPLEDVGGAGSEDSHWRESIFKNELMTSRIAAVGVAMPFSKMTVAALADMGYTTNPAAADAYTFGSAALLDLQAIREAQGVGELVLNDVVDGPVARLSTDGTITRLRPKR